jgi:hypothetical protein
VIDCDGYIVMDILIGYIVIGVLVMHCIVLCCIVFAFLGGKFKLFD